MINEVIVVEFCARAGIFNNMLFRQIKVNLEPTASAMESIKRQSQSILIKFFPLSFPDIKVRSPVNTMEAEAKMPNKIVAITICNIIYL